MHREKTKCDTLCLYDLAIYSFTKLLLYMLLSTLQYVKQFSQA